MEKQEFIKSKVDSIIWDFDIVTPTEQIGMRKIYLYAKSYYHQTWQHIGIIDYDIDNNGHTVQPVVMGKDKYYYYNSDNMKYYKTCEEAKNYSKNQYIKSVKLKANWEFKKGSN